MAMIGCRSVTYAQRAVVILGKAGLKANIAKLPSYLPDTDCSNAVEIDDDHLNRALKVMKDYDFPVKHAYCWGGDGRLEECL